MFMQRKRTYMHAQAVHIQKTSQISFNLTGTLIQLLEIQQMCVRI